MIAHGSVVWADGSSIGARLPAIAIGSGVRVRGSRGEITGIVTALRSGHALVAPCDSIEGISSGDPVCSDPAAAALPLGTALLGRAVDARARALDGGLPVRGRARSTALTAPDPADRGEIEMPFWTGICAVDALLTIGRGARIGVFGPPGCGKSTLLHRLVRRAHADAIVVGLCGERGREAEEWMRVRPAHASIICATSDRSAAERVQAAHVAMAQAAVLRARGLHVLLILDSLARYAAALREIALAGGETAGRGGYPPSVFANLAQLVEVAGSTKCGSITMVASVLSDGDERDPVSDAARSLLDGHLALSPHLAQAGRFPAIDVVASTSRTMRQVVDDAHDGNARLVRRALTVLAQTEEARTLGIIPGDPFGLRAVAAEPALEALLRAEGTPEQSLAALAAAADTLK